MLKDLVVFDWEVFPNWNCVCWNIYNGTDDYETHVITSDDHDYLKKLKDMAYSGYLTGFNIKGYDLQILKFAIDGWTPQELYDHSMSIIKSDDSHWKSLAFWGKFQFTDLFDDLKTMGSLKQFESNTGLMIKESSVPFGKEDLTEEDKAEIIRYCKHDIFATNRLVKARWGYLTAKATCSKLSSLSEAECLKNTAPKVCAKMIYAKQKVHEDGMTYNIPERLDPIFRKYIHPTIINNFVGQPLVNNFEYSVKYLKNTFVFGTGGVHSTLADALWCKSDNNYILVNADFENLYPSLLTEYDYWPAGVPEAGRELFKFLLSECRRLKAHLKTLDKSTTEYYEQYLIRDAIKLIMNAATGSMRQKFSPLYDPQQIIALCMTGQLLTVCMAKIVFDMGAQVIQTNTDGIIFRIHRSKLAEIKTVLAQFSKDIHLPLEVDEQYAIFQRNVNNYIMYATPTSAPKLKGRWAKKSGSDVPLTPLNAPIINEAMIAFYKSNKPIEQTISECTDPLKFMFTTMKGRTYTGVMYESEIGDVETLNVNRVYATTNRKVGTLRKIAMDEFGDIIKRDKIASIPDNCGLCNDSIAGIPNDIDYQWYVKETRKALVDMLQVA